MDSCLETEFDLKEAGANTGLEQEASPNWDAEIPGYRPRALVCPDANERFDCLARARRGDPAAVAQVVDALRPRLWRMAVYYGRCTGEDPEDLLQEAWVGLLESLPRLDLRIGVPEQHLVQRARWRLLDAVRRARVRRCAPLEEEMLEQLAPAVAPHAEATACAGAFTRQLNSTQQTVLRCLLSGLTWRESARVMGCTSANIAYHVRQIRRRYEEWSG